MRFSFLRQIGLALALVPSLLLAATGEEDQITLRNVLEKARNMANLKVRGIDGYHLHGDVRIWMKKDAPTQGKYTFTWTREGKWREEITFNGYKRVRSGDGKQFWQVRSPEVENPAISDLDMLLRVGRGLNIEEGDKLKKIRAEKIEGIDADCIREISAKGYAQTFCFNASSGDLLRYTPERNSNQILWRVVWSEYSRYQQWGSKSFPRTLRGFNGKQLVIEVQLEEIGSAVQFASDFFDPPNEATVWSDCTDVEPWKIKDRIQPVYPQTARMGGVQGTVILYAVIEEDGRVSNLRIAHSAGIELDQAAATAVSHWRYERSNGCADLKGRTETFIDVMFWLQY